MSSGVSVRAAPTVAAAVVFRWAEGVPCCVRVVANMIGVLLPAAAVMNVTISGIVAAAAAAGVVAMEAGIGMAAAASMV